MESILPVAVIPIVPIPNRPSRRKTISIPSVRRKVCARRSRPASVRGFFGQPAHFPTMGLPATLVPARKRSDALPIHCARSAMSSRTRAASGAPVAFETGGVASRRSWAATTQVHIDENHGTLRRVGLAAGAKSSPPCSSTSNQDGKIWQLRLVPAEPAPSTRLNLSVPTRHRTLPRPKTAAFIRAHQHWPLARDQGVIGLSQCNRRNRAKSPSVEQSVSLCSAASAATRSQAATMWAGSSARRPRLARLQATQLELRGVHPSSDGPVSHQGLGSRLLVSRRIDVCAAGMRGSRAGSRSCGTRAS
jgi:hypothetical protein